MMSYVNITLQQNLLNLKNRSGAYFPSNTVIEEWKLQILNKLFFSLITKNK